jgi:hypothetical protein
MSDYKSALEKIRVILGMETIKDVVETEVELEEEVIEEIIESTETTLAETKLEDGTLVYHDGEVAVGTALFTDAELLEPLTDGTYTLESGDGFTIEIGVITELTPKTEEEIPTEEAPEEEALAEDFEEKYNDLLIIVEELKSKLENFSTQEIKLKSELEKLSSEPEMESIANATQDQRELSPLEKRLNHLASLRGLVKKK